MTRPFHANSESEYFPLEWGASKSDDNVEVGTLQFGLSTRMGAGQEHETGIVAEKRVCDVLPTTIASMEWK